MKCPNCGFEDEGKFCSNCGRPLTEETSLESAKENTIKLGFGKASSVNYGYVVDHMKKQPTYSLGPDNIHTAVFSPDDIEAFFEIFDFVKGWKTCFIEITGSRVPISKIRTGLSCFRERRKAFNPEKYCFGYGDGDSYTTNPLGCRLCGITNQYWRDGWFTIGTLSRSGIFTVNKEQIKHIVKNKLEGIGYCPVIDADSIMQRIDQLPDKINPKVNKDFEYVTTWEDGKSIATGIRMKDRYSGYVVERESETNEINIDLSEAATSKQTKKAGCAGCGTLMAIISVALFLIILISIF